MLPKIRKIVYATGLGPAAPYVFRYALALARLHKAEIVAVSGVEPLSPFAQSLVELHISHAMSAEMHKKGRETVKENLRRRIRLLCEKEENGDKPDGCGVSDIRVVEGQPAQVVLAVADEIDADLIVMGSHRHTVLGEAVLGNTTSKVLHGTGRPVLVVRIPEGYREEGF
ncbi:MAG TPA: universal stress protein [Deferrimonas sp.]|jgi:nucleotide-binding universal stress UspA family protein